MASLIFCSKGWCCSDSRNLKSSLKKLPNFISSMGLTYLYSLWVEKPWAQCHWCITSHLCLASITGYAFTILLMQLGQLVIYFNLSLMEKQIRNYLWLFVGQNKGIVVFLVFHPLTFARICKIMNEHIFHSKSKLSLFCQSTLIGSGEVQRVTLMELKSITRYNWNIIL